jgi:DNA modification methylase
VLTGKKIQNIYDKVYNEDVFKMLERIPDESVNVVYGDPDYNVGCKYNGKGYTKNFEEYIEWYTRLAKESLRILKKDGNLFFINYPKQNSYLRVKFLDDNCARVNDYAWVYNTNIGHSGHKFTRAHRSILHCTKSKRNKFYKEQIALPYKNPTDRRIKKLIEKGAKGRMPYSWLYFDLVKNVSTQKTVHSCQIPQGLTELLFKSCTKKGDIAVVLFGGSGSELEVAKQLGLHYISAEIDKKYCRIIKDRLKKGYVSQEYRMLNEMKKKDKITEEITLFKINY